STPRPRSGRRWSRYRAPKSTEPSAGSTHPHHRLARADPAFVARRVDFLDAIALDLEGRRDEAVVDRPRLDHDHQAIELLVRVERGVHLRQVRRQRLFECTARAVVSSTRRGLLI